VDTFECGRSHGDALPEGVSSENVKAVRSLLSQDYATAFQVNLFSRSQISTVAESNFYVVFCMFSSVSNN